MPVLEIIFQIVPLLPQEIRVSAGAVFVNCTLKHLILSLPQSTPLLPTPFRGFAYPTLLNLFTALRSMDGQRGLHLFIKSNHLKANEFIQEYMYLYICVFSTQSSKQLLPNPHPLRCIKHEY